MGQESALCQAMCACLSVCSRRRPVCPVALEQTARPHARSLSSWWWRIGEREWRERTEINERRRRPTNDVTLAFVPYGQYIPRIHRIQKCLSLSSGAHETRNRGGKRHQFTLGCIANTHVLFRLISSTPQSSLFGSLCPLCRLLDLLVRQDCCSPSQDRCHAR